jgi:MHS family proline/betaine transporter-like MFS transporter
MNTTSEAIDSATASEQTAVKPRLTALKAIAAASIGNALEFYDLLVYGYFAITIGKLFFPTGDEWSSLLLSVGSFGISFLMRPLGSIVLGTYADRVGRKPALTLSIMLMMIGTGILAFIPTYATIGVWAPIIVVVARMIQGFSSGGQFGSATAFMVEFASKDKRGLAASFQACTQGLATVFAAGVAALLTGLLTPAEVMDWGWRVAFLLGLSIGPVGFYIQKNMPETPEFEAEKAVQKRSNDKVSPLKETLTTGLSSLLMGGGVVVAVTAFNYVQKVYMPTYAIKQLGIPDSASMVGAVMTGLMVMLGAPFFGMLSDRIGRIRTITFGMLAIGLSTYPMFKILIASPTAMTFWIVQSVVGLLLAAVLAPLPALLSEIFPTRNRGTGLSLSYNVAVTVFGGFAPLIVTWLIGVTGDKASPSFYVLGTILLSLSCLGLLVRRARISATLPN